MPATFMLWFMLAGIAVVFIATRLVNLRMQAAQLVEAGSIIGIILVGIAAWTILLTRSSKRHGQDYSRNN
jgi:anaerobic C4-dicarboxylate transporter